MTTIIETLNEDARVDLIRDDLIELVSIVAGFVPASQGLTGPVTLVPRCSVYTECEIQPPWLTEDIARIREISEGFEHDLSGFVKEAIRADLRLQQEKFVEASTHESFKPFVGCVELSTTIWAVAWCAGMADDGKVTVDREEYCTPHQVRDNHFAYDVFMNDRITDRATRAKIGIRLGKLSRIMDRIIRRLHGGMKQ
jgi:hypothetical protein